jgi:hypothetical protein
MADPQLPPLNGEARALIDAGRDAADPDVPQRDATYALLAQKLAAGAAAGGGLGGATLGNLSKVAVALLGAGAVVTAVWAGVRTPARTTRAPSAAPVRAPATEPEPEPAAPTPAAPAVDEAAAKPAARTVKLKKPAAAGPSTRQLTIAPASARLAQETELLRATNAALNAGQADHALRLLARYDRHFPDGLLREERAASEVLALCLAGKPSEATRQRARFLREYPRSPLNVRVERACSDAPDAATEQP